MADPVNTQASKSRPAVPADAAVRAALLQAARDYVARHRLVPPLTLEELRAHATAIVNASPEGREHLDFVTVLVGNETWRNTLAGIPYDRRVLLLPQCLRDHQHCPAEMDEFGLLCEQCGRCAIGAMQAEAEALGYVVLVAEGTTVVTKLLEQGHVDAVVGVSCLHVLERAFPSSAAHAIPGIAIPLCRDGCVNTEVDCAWLREALHLRSSARWPGRIDLDRLKREVESWFQADALRALLNTHGTWTEETALSWLAQAGKRWRPLLTVCVYKALAAQTQDESVSDTVRKVALATECFHKASLLHDDIEDGDDYRYGEMTLARKHGVPLALNLGDFLIGEGYRLLADCGAPAGQSLRMLAIAAEGHRNLCLGQGDELCWVRQPAPLATRQVLDFFRRKTSPAFDVALRLGAVCAGGTPEVEQVLSRFSEALGIAFQIRDDLEDFFHPENESDAEALRPSILVSLAYELADDATRRQIEDAWHDNQPAGQRQRLFGDIFRMLRIEDKARQMLEHYRKEAVRSLSPLDNAHLKILLQRLVNRVLGATAPDSPGIRPAQ